MTSPATPRFSIFTPSHQPRFLDECLASLQAQTYSDWEWIVLLNIAMKEGVARCGGPLLV
ncbi:hypothetical protein [Streptomyces gibsoniae]|uniref:Uncharacterized protein n=1 Tax=Streptomyces gibsoniae TaxID=3075529 RepID=A0ABU2U1E0_9ACTN|nr:hypothetical protein [Streptomyces sp. DSM 41699]MDT0467048.1 hypothetical protein [Streptomyces sp. DSM 41699]